MARRARQLVGREVELAAIEEHIDSAAGGRARMVLCSGEAGIGKTRLAEELTIRAQERGFVVAWGIADDSVGAPPHWPWTQVLRALDSTVELRELAAARQLGQELARLVPDYFPDLAPDAETASPEHRFRLFDAVTTVVREASRLQPVVVVFDDVHWADEESVLLLRHMTASLTGERVVLWVNLRIGAQEAAFAWWTRVPGALELRLPALDVLAVRRQLEALTGRAISGHEAERVRALTSGNPLFVGEMASTLGDEVSDRPGPVVTAGTRMAVAGRLGRLRVEARELLGVAAVLGREFEVAVLAAAAGISEAECLDALDEAELAGLVESAALHGRHRFVHALVRDAIEDALASSRRAELHRAAAEAIEARHGAALGSHAFEIAQHWAAASVVGERATAASWLEAAADLAMAQLGFEAAARLYEQALDVGGADIGAGDRSRLLLRAAAAMNRSGNLGGCHRCRMAAVAAAPADARVDVMTDAALVMDPGGRPGFDLATRHLCEEVLGSIGSEPSARRARLTARFAETFIYLPDDQGAERASAQAVEVAEAADDTAALVAAWRARQVVVSHPDRLDERSYVAERLVDVGRRTGDAEVMLRGHLCRIDALFERGLLGTIGPELDIAETLADKAGSALGRYLVTHTRAVLAQAMGRVAAARRLSDDAIALGGWGHHPDPTYRRAAVLSGIARYAGPDDLLLPAITTTEGPKPPFIADLATAHTMAALGRLADALDLWQSLGPPRQWHPPSHVVLISAALGMETAIALGRDDDVDTLSRLLEPYRGHHVTCGLGAASYLGPVELWLGKAALHAGRTETAVAELSAAARVSREAGAAGAEMESAADLAAALVRHGDHEGAHRLVATTLPTAEQLGLAAIAVQLRRVGEGVAAPIDALTDREREVASLVAKGLTNREIANRLVVSERTAQNHVQHILTKLGFTNRTQIARWAAPGR